MTGDQVADMLLALPSELRVQVVNSLATGVVLRARDDEKLPDLLASMLGAWGVAIVIVDQNGAKLLDAWNGEGPRGKDVTRVMDQVHKAVSDVLDGLMHPRRPS